MWRRLCASSFLHYFRFYNPVIAAYYVSNKPCDIKGIIKTTGGSNSSSWEGDGGSAGQRCHRLHCRVDKTTAPYSKPHESNPQRSHPTSLRRTWMLSPHLHLNAPTGPSHWVVKLKFCYVSRIYALCSSILTEYNIIRSSMTLTPHQISFGWKNQEERDGRGL